MIRIVIAALIGMFITTNAIAAPITNQVGWENYPYKEDVEMIDDLQIWTRRQVERVIGKKVEDTQKVVIQFVDPEFMKVFVPNTEPGWVVSALYLPAVVGVEGVEPIANIQIGKTDRALWKNKVLQADLVHEYVHHLLTQMKVSVCEQEKIAYVVTDTYRRKVGLVELGYHKCGNQPAVYTNIHRH